MNELREVEENNNSIRTDMGEIVKLLNTQNADIKDFNLSLKCKLDEHRKVKEFLEKEYSVELSEMKKEKEVFIQLTKVCNLLKCSPVLTSTVYIYRKNWQRPKILAA